MELNWLESILYAFISGLTEFLPVSSRAHQAILLYLFGDSSGAALLNLVIHVAALLALTVNCRKMIATMKRTQKLLAIPPRRRKRQPDRKVVSDIRLIKSAAIYVLILVLLYKLTETITGKLQILSFCLILNGVFLYISGHIPVGNKDSGDMTRFDSLLFGIASGCGIVPGISRIGAGVSVAVMRGTSVQNALNWSLVLSVPAIAALCIADFFTLFTVGIGSFGFLILLQYLVCAVFAYLGAHIAMILLRFIAMKGNLSLFSFYSWGLALFSFILFMI